MSAADLRQRIPDPEILLSLEPEELAGVLLPILRKAGASYQGKISGYNFCNELNQFQEVYPRQLELDVESRTPRSITREWPR
jgi:hypothetical protein